MQAFIDFIEKKYSSEKIIFKAHPKDRMKSTYSLKHGTFSEDNSRSLILSAKLVHGINSSVLYEAALAKKAVIAEGNCLLTSVTAPIESILAAMVARQHHIDQTFFDEQKLHRFSHFKESLVTALVK